MLQPDGSLELDKHKIARAYFRSWFFFDLIAAFPFDLFISSSDVNLGFAKVPRLLRLRRFMRFADSFQAAKVLRLVYLIFFFLLIAHWIGCMWWRIGTAGGASGWMYRADIATLLIADSDVDVQSDWSAQLQAVDHLTLRGETNHTYLQELYESNRVSLGKQYLTSLYWALTVVMKSPWLHPSQTTEQAQEATHALQTLLIRYRRHRRCLRL